MCQRESIWTLCNTLVRKWGTCYLCLPTTWLAAYTGRSFYCFSFSFSCHFVKTVPCNRVYLFPLEHTCKLLCKAENCWNGCDEDPTALQSNLDSILLGCDRRSWWGFRRLYITRFDPGLCLVAKREFYNECACVHDFKTRPGIPLAWKRALLNLFIG